MNVDGLNVMNSRRLFAHIREQEAHKLPAAQWTRATIETAAGPRDVLIHPVTGFAFAWSGERLDKQTLRLVTLCLKPQVMKRLKADSLLDLYSALIAVVRSHAAN